MEKSIQLLSEILPLLDAYVREAESPSVHGFFEKNAPTESTNLNDPLAADLQNTSNKIGFFITHLFKFVKIYTKTALKDTEINTIDEFAFLAGLMQNGSMHKTALIKSNHMEVPSGTEIIKRLLKNALLEEFDDPIDRRSVRVRLTERGRGQILQSFGQMNKVSNVVMADLSVVQKVELYKILNQLYGFHILHLEENLEKL
jgi:MarR family transcriptional regulator, lower aerobic nicotinate degradation pathway regulator